MSLYNQRLIQSFKSKALEQLFSGKPKLIEADLRRKVENILGAIQVATDIEALNLPGFRLHELKGDRAGTWSIAVNKNWRITFTFADGQANDLDLEDYH